MEIWRELFGIADTIVVDTAALGDAIYQNPDANGSVEPLERAPVKPYYRSVIRHDRRWGRVARSNTARA